VRELAAAQRRIRRLEADLKVAEEAVARRHPDSLANLIREAKGATQAVGEPAVVLAELEKLKVTTAEAEEGQDRRLRALRQEHERMRADFERREAALKDEAVALRARLSALGDSAAGVAPGAAGPASDDGAAISRREMAMRSRVKELETELERVRAFYAKKVRDDRGSAPSLAPASSPSPTAMLTARANAATAAVYMAPRSATPGSGKQSPSQLQRRSPTRSEIEAGSAASPGGGPEAEADAEAAAATGLNESGNAEVEGPISPDAAPPKSLPAPPPRMPLASRGSALAAKPAASKPMQAAPVAGRRASIASVASRLSATKSPVPTVLPTPAGRRQQPQPSAKGPAIKGAADGRVAASPAPGKGSPGKKATSASTRAASASDTEEDAEPATSEEGATAPAAAPAADAVAALQPPPPTVASLLGQVARLEADNSQLKEQAADALRRLESTPAARASEHAVYLQRQLHSLYAAVALLEERADARELELARAEQRVLHAREAGALLERANLEAALQAKDNALRVARSEIQALADAIAEYRCDRQRSESRLEAVAWEAATKA